MDNNLSSKLNTVNDNINMMRDGLGLDRSASIETVRTKVIEKRKVKPMEFTFEGYSSGEIENLDLIDITNHADLRNMFKGCWEVTNLNAIGEWNVSGVKYMSHAFDNCRAMKDFSMLNNWNMSGISQINYAFARCAALEKIELNWSIDIVTSIEGMFYQCGKLKEIILPNATFRSVVYANTAFREANKLEKLDIRSAVFSTRSEIYCNNIFYGVPANCLIIVKNDAEKAWILTQRSDFTNVKTVAEYEATL